jgi:hypothetical protein
LIDRPALQGVELLVVPARKLMAASAFFGDKKKGTATITLNVITTAIPAGNSRLLARLVFLITLKKPLANGVRPADFVTPFI